MPYVPETSTINQRVQLGAESTSALGTAVPASKLIQCFDFTLGINPNVSMYRPMGHKYATIQEENFEESSITVAGDLDFNGVLYLLASTMGSVSPVAHGVSTTAKDWIFVPPIFGTVVPQTYTIQQGDSVRARSFSYGIFNSFGYKGDRKTPISVSATGFGQLLTDNIVLTSNPTAVALAPVVGKFINIYIDSTSANIGTTQILRPLAIDYSMGSIYNAFYVFNRANPSYTAHIDAVPQPIFKLMLEANAEGMAYQTNLQQGTTVYARVQAQGNVIDNLQTVSLGSPSAGNFTLTYKSVTTGNIAYNATAATVQTALTGLSTVGTGNATVTGSAGGPYSVIFTGTLANDTTAMTGSGAGLTGGTFTVTQNQSYNIFQHDMALKVSKVTPFQDKDGLYAIEWEFTLVEDPNWASGQAQKVTVTNLITAL